jgi:hypothetical protein
MWGIYSIGSHCNPGGVGLRTLNINHLPGDVARRTFNAIICIRNFNKDAQRFMLPLICLAVVEQLHSMLLLYSSTGLKQRAPPEHIKLGAARLGFTTQGAGTCAPCIKLLA